MAKKKTKKRNGSDWPGPRIGRKAALRSKAGRAARKTKRKVARKKK
jgi:hypothetical protein